MILFNKLLLDNLLSSTRRDYRFIVRNSSVFVCKLSHCSYQQDVEKVKRESKQSILRLPKLILDNKQWQSSLFIPITRSDRIQFFFGDHRYQYQQRREFKPVNHFTGPQKRFGDRAFEYLLTFLGSWCFFYALFDIKYIWENSVPEKIAKPVQKFREKIANFVKSNFRKADSLGLQDRCDDQSDSELPLLASEKNNSSIDLKILKHKIIDSLISVFKYDYESSINGFRWRRIIEYENRIRMYSNPEKVFRYFATVKLIHSETESEVFMTPEDFWRSITPSVKQPDHYGLDKYKIFDLSKKSHQDHRDFNIKSDSIFFKLSKNGLINFTDFLFLLTVISVSSRNFKIAFRMFDFNGDGQVEYEEFAKVQNAILAQTSHGRKLGKSNRYKGLSSAVSRYFFGENLDRRLSIDEFVRFQESLQKELLMLEFERKNPDPLTNRISEIDFADLLVVYAQFSQRKKQRMNQRLRTRFSKRISPNDNDGISFDDYLDFFHFLKNINDVDIALAMYNIAGVSIDQETFKHVAKSVANVDLPDYLLVLIFLIFDDDEDGQLSHKEFIAIMKERLRRGLSRPKDTGLLSILSVIAKSLLSFKF